MGKAGEGLGAFEMGIGFHQPQANYDKYVDSGLSLRFVYTYQDPDFHFIRYDAAIQYLGFKNDVWLEELSSGSTYGPPLWVKNSEQSLALLLGARLMSPTRHGAIRPYVGVKGGLFFFYESITWEWEDSAWCWLLEDCEDNSYTTIVDSEFHLGWILETGTNIYFKKNLGLDLGLQYTVVPGIKKPHAAIEDEDEQIFKTISRKINANYVSVYFGISFPINR